MKAVSLGRILLAAAGFALAAGTGAAPAGDAAPAMEPSAETASVDPREVLPGQPFVFFVSGPEAPQVQQAFLVSASGKIAARGRFLALEDAKPGEQARAAFLAAPSTLAPGIAKLRAVSASGHLLAETELAILPREFLREEIPLNEANTAIRTSPDPLKTAEAEEIYRIFGRFDAAAVWSSGPFILPADAAPRTASFGDRRIYRYATGGEDTSIHAGVDFGVVVGTQVRAAAAGRVVLAKDRIVTGKSVVVEHLPGIYSAYYHLSQIEVSPGDLIAAGACIGLSGSTGISTGPHLHWEVRVSGEAADPDAFTSWRVLDKDSLISRMKRSSPSN